jgi:RHS repeat-associated protein
MNTIRDLLSSFLFSGLIFLAAPIAFGQTNDPAQLQSGFDGTTHWGTIAPLKTDEFGDHLDLYSGNLQFNQVDISLPGNSALPVRLGRRFDPGLSPKEAYGYFPIFTVGTNPMIAGYILNTSYGLADFGDWTIDVPNISGYIAASLGWKSNQCSGGSLFPLGFSQVTSDPLRFWSGWNLQDENPGSRVLLHRLSTTTIPYPSDVQIETTDNWIVRCLSNATNAAGTAVGEGFLAISPQGKKYYFNKLLLYPAAPAYVTTNGSKPITAINRYLARMVATRVEDRFGNYVNYNYDTSGRLTSIIANDGREIDLTWTTQSTPVTGVVANVVQTATAAGQTWMYGYDGTGTLSTVTRPDGLNWSFNLAAFYTPRLQSNLTANGRFGAGCYIPSSSSSATITTPEGLVGSFTMNTIERGIAHLADRRAPGSNLNQPESPVNCNFALLNKQLSGPGISTLSWQYEYSDNAGSFGAAVPAATVQTTTIVDPEGVVTKYTASDSFDWTEGNITQVDIYASSSSTSPTRTTAFTYQQGPKVGDDFQGFLLPYINYDRREQSPRLLSRSIAQDGDTYTRTTPSNQFDAFGFPLQIVRSNSFGSSATDTFTYLDDTSLWVLGAQVTHSVNGVLAEKNVYNTSDEVQETDQFGLLEFTYGYDATGVLRTKSDGLTHTTKYDNYAFGSPQLTTFADQNTTSQVINSDGTVASTTDGRGYKTSYAYDSLSRLQTITYPAADTVAWAQVHISWQKVTSSPFGPAAMLQTQSDGHLTRSIYFDPLLRPIFEQETDASTGINRYRRRSFDSADRLVYQSYPDSSVSTSNGVSTLYDALGRTTRSTDAVGLLTSISYSSSNSRTVTDGNSHSVVYRSQAFDAPGGDLVTNIQAPETQTTQIARDVFGHVTAVTQSGTYSGSAVSSQRTYVYDAYYRQCKSVDPESGETAVQFDAADNVVWKAVGQTQSPTSCSDSSSTSNGTVLTYDARNRLMTVTPPAGSEPLGYSYDPDGRVLTKTTTNSGWTYVYDHRGLPEKQTLVIAGQTLNIVDAYDPQGHQSQRTTPSGLVLAYSPDAWGNATTVGSYATSISYYPSGSINAFTYGNGVTYSAALDSRLRPHTIKMAGSVAGDMIDVTYGYDPVGNVQTISDAGARGDSRTLGYDGLNRLTSISSAILGSMTAAYDPLNNIRNQQSSVAGSIFATYDASSNRISGITGIYTRTFSYSAAGDITSDGVNQSSFDVLHRLTGISGGVTAQYLYDASYRRVKTVNSTGTTLSVYDQAGEFVYELTTNTGVATDYLSIDGQPIAQVTASAVTYLHADPLGSPGAATDSTGKLLWYELYLPYGSKVDNVAERISFAGHVQDADSGLINMQDRYYSPVLGRFISTDALPVDPANPFSFNRYAYAKNNPQRFKDPNGKSPIDIIFLAVDIVELGEAIASGSGVGAAVVSVGLDLVGVASPIPGTGETLKALKTGVEIAEHTAELAKVASEAEHAASAGERAAVGYANNTGAKIGEGRKFTQGQSADFKAQNIAKNNGVLRSDESGIELVSSQQSKRGVTPPSNEVAIDHYNPRNPTSGTRGSNDGSNARVVSRGENGAKSNKPPKEKSE